VPIIFHFGGLSSVVLPESLDQVNYLSAGYGPEYGRAMGGLVGVTTQNPESSRWKGFGFADVFNAGALVEGPTGKKGSFLLGARGSYFAPLLKAFAPKTNGLAFTALPFYTDFISTYQVQASQKNSFKVVTLGSLDTLTFVLDRPTNRDPSLRLNNQTAFFRIIPQLTHQHGPRSVSKLSFGFGKDWNIIDVSSQYIRNIAWALTTRGDHERKFNPYWTSQWGFDHRYQWANVSIRLISNSGGVEREENINARSPLLGLYWRNEIKPWKDSPITILPHARFDYYSAIRDYLVQPRMAIRFVPRPDWLLRTAGGLYSQPPQDSEFDPTFGNPQIKAPKSWHFSAGIEKDFRKGGTRGVNTMLGTFYRSFDQLVVRSSSIIERDGTRVAENYNNTGKGRAYGGEALVKVNYQPFDGWLTYTLSRSTRWDSSTPETIFRYDQTHIFAALFGWNAPKNWRIATRFRVVSGNPYTKITEGIFDSDTDVYVPIFGDRFTERFDPFIQWDIRIDKRFIFKNWILSLYLDVQNVTYQKNAEGIARAYDYSSSVKILGMPILPLFGLKGEF
jgi:hypothetical protein